MIASIKGYKELAELLIEKGVDINLQDIDGWTALIHAKEEGNNEIIELLIEKGADPTIEAFTTFERIRSRITAFFSF